MNWALLRILRHSQTIMYFGGLITGLGLLIISVGHFNPDRSNVMAGIFVIVVGLGMSAFLFIYTRTKVFPELKSRLPVDEGGTEP